MLSNKIQVMWRSMLITGVILLAAQLNAKTKPQEPIPLNELSAFTEAYYQLKSSYVKPVDDVALLRAAIQGMVGSLDSHSRFMPPDEFERFNTDNQGEYAGLGLRFNEHKFGIEVAEVLKNSPASRAGIKIGMIVTEIDNQPINFLPATDAMEMLAGGVGSQVTLKIAAVEFAQPRVFVLTREIILLESVSHQILPGQIGYLKLSQFTLKSVQEFRAATDDFTHLASLKGLIIDLRDNPGGVMEVAVELADLFVSQGKLLISTGRTADSNQTFYASKVTPLKNVRVLVVINGHSASASEIFAAALKDHNRATILGETSYGKGSIQSVVALNHESGMKFTTAEYFSPKGLKIQDVGVKPTVLFAEPEIKNTYNVSLLDDIQLLQAYNLLSKNK